MPEIEKEYIQTGKVKYAVMNLPQTECTNPPSPGCAEAAACAGEQGKSWRHRYAFANQQAIDQWKSYRGSAVGPARFRKFQERMDSRRQAAQVRSGYCQGTNSAHRHRRLLPAFTGRKEHNDKTVTRLMSQPFASFKAAIDEQLVESPIEAMGAGDGRCHAERKSRAARPFQAEADGQIADGSGEVRIAAACAWA